MIEDVEHRVVFIQSNLESRVGAEGDIAEDDTQSDRDEQQGLEILFDGEVDEYSTHRNHNEVTCRGIGKASVGKELIKVLNYEICKSHKPLLSDCEQHGTFHYRVARINNDRCDCSCIFSLDVVLHLHGFEHENGVAYIHLVAHLHAD